jgi:hypothetical protein
MEMIVEEAGEKRQSRRERTKIAKAIKVMGAGQNMQSS